MDPNAERTINGETSREVRYFISSLPGDDAKKFGAAVRRCARRPIVITQIAPT